MTIFNLPDLGEGLTEATLLSWLVSEGDQIAVDQPLAEVETAKSVVEVPSPYAGTVETLHGTVGEEMVVGGPLVTVDDGTDASGDDSGGGAGGEGAADGEGGADSGALGYREEERAGTAPDAELASDRSDAGTAEADEGSGNVLIGYGTSSAGRGRRRRRRGRGGGGSATPAAAAGSAQESHRAPRVSSPLVRRLAREHGVALSGLTGSGRDGLIMRSDVQAAVAAADRGSPAEATSSTSGPADAAEPAAAAVGSARIDAEAVPAAPDGLNISQRTAVTGMRRAVATKMAQSRSEIPEVTIWQDVDLTELVELRSRLKTQSEAEVPSVLSLLARFTLAGLARHPELASRIDDRDDGTQEIVGFDGVNLGIAAQTEKGLVVPVIRRADRLSARGLHGEIGRVIDSAREGSISGKELTGGTFTVNNYGVFGTDGATPIINHPEAAILGIGRIMDRPWAVDGELTVRKIATVSLAFDHRVCDGGAAGGFLSFVAGCLESPEAALTEL